MVCPVCPTAGMFGGYVGGYFGINTPKTTELQVASALITASLIVVTVVALKYFFGISVCDGNGDFSLRNIVQVGVITFILGVIYSIAINFLINLWFSGPTLPPLLLTPQNDASHHEAPSPCCCTNISINS